MFDTLKKKTYFYKSNLMYKKGILEGKIVPFDDEFYQRMNNTFFNSVPISMHIKYLRPILPPGKCFDRSLLMFFCFDDALLVRADNKDMELMYGDSHAGHGWIEMNGYVYDPSLLMRFDKELYYKIHCPSNVHRITKEDYIKINGDYYNEVRSTKIQDFQIGGNKRDELCVNVLPIIELAKCSNNQDFQNEVEEYLKLIQYDQKQSYDELLSKFQKSLKNKYM